MKARRGRYIPLDRALIRAPLLPADTVSRTAGDGVALPPDDPAVTAAITVASTDMAEALARTTADHAKAPRVRAKLLRYLIRMSTRCTPYGLFAGVGLVEWGRDTDLALGEAVPHTHTRPDMGWLLDLVAALERDADIRPNLRLVAGPTPLLRHGRMFTAAGASPSIRATAAVRRVLDLARSPVTREEIFAALATVAGATPDKAERLVEELLRCGFLRHDLQPPLTGDPVSYVSRRLADHPIASRLTELRKALAEWDTLPLENRADGWRELVRRVEAIHPAIDRGDLLQTDLTLPLTRTRLNRRVGAEAARAAELLLRLSPYPGGAPHLIAYRQAFEARYGRHREVPLLELLHPEFGLGPPTARGNGVSLRDGVLHELAVNALQRHLPEIELDDDLLRRLETWRPEAAPGPPTLDLAMLLAARSPEAVDRGEFQLIVGPGGTNAAGRYLGRFADLLGQPALATLERIAEAEAAQAPGRLLAEVSYTPSTNRSANVAIRPSCHQGEILFETPPSGSGQRVVPVEELVVGIRDGRFIVRWPAGDMEVVAMQGHMLNPMNAPPVARFLLDVATDGRCSFATFDWGTAARLPYLPRIRRGRIVVSLAQWRVDPATIRDATDLTTWRTEQFVPRHVYLTMGDNRLLLDLDDPAQAALLQAERAGHHVMVQEALPGPGHAWLPGPGGGYLSELIVPLALHEQAPPPTRPRRSRPVPAEARYRPPGSDWLYLRLYGPSALQDELITDSVDPLGRFATAAGLSDGWFFLRYADPDPHLRIRFHGEPSTLLGPLISEVCRWATELLADGACTRFAFDTYEREIERYGGLTGIHDAERVFVADSAAVAELLRIRDTGTLPHDPTITAVASVDDLLDSLGLSTEARAALYHDTVDLSRDGGKEYRRHSRDLRSLLGRAHHLAPPVAAAFIDRRRALPSVTPSPDVCRSHVHMHCNRLLGTDHHQEHRVLELLRRTRDSLTHASLDPRTAAT